LLTNVCPKEGTEQHPGSALQCFVALAEPFTHPETKRGRRTKAAQRTPGKGREERTPADAPFGARRKALLLHLQTLPVFR